MIEGLKRFREQGSFLVLAAVGLSVALSLVSALRTWLGTHQLGSLGAFGHSLIGPINASLLVVVAVICAAWHPPAPRAFGITVTAAIIATVGTLVQFVFGLFGQIWPPIPQPVISRVLDAVGFAVFTMIPAVATYVLWKMAAGLRRETRAGDRGRAAGAGRSRRKGRGGAAPGELAERPAESATSDEPTVAVAAPRPEPEPEPEWKPDPAAGAVWHSAGDAAAGGAASGWGVPGQSGGRIPGQEKHENPRHAAQDAGAVEAPDASRIPASDDPRPPVSDSGPGLGNTGRPDPALEGPNPARAPQPRPQTGVSQGERHPWLASAGNVDEPEDATPLDLRGEDSPLSRWRPVRGPNGEDPPRR